MEKKNNWIEIFCSAPKDRLELINQELEANGACAISLYADDSGANNDILEPAPNQAATLAWDLSKVVGLFEEKCDLKAILTNLQAKIPELTWHTKILGESNWVDKWQDYIKPQKLSDNFWVSPYLPNDQKSVALATNNTVLYLPPGLAFGTGTHPTTYLCLEYLANNIDLKDKTIIDFGCGSGILGLASIKLAAKNAIFVDIDQQAIDATIENAKLNNIDPSLIQMFGPSSDLHKIEPSDILVANILANPLLELKDLFNIICKKTIILSGILEHQADLIIQNYAKYFYFNEPIMQDNWVLLTGTKHEQL